MMHDPDYDLKRYAQDPDDLLVEEVERVAAAHRGEPSFSARPLPRHLKREIRVQLRARSQPDGKPRRPIRWKRLVWIALAAILFAALALAAVHISLRLTSQAREGNYLGISNNQYGRDENSYVDFSGIQVPDPAYLPEGFEAEDIQGNLDVCWILYRKESDVIKFWRYRCSTGISANLGEIGTEVETKIGNSSGFIAETGECVAIVWGTKPTYVLQGSKAMKDAMLVLAEHMIEHS